MKLLSSHPGRVVKKMIYAMLLLCLLLPLGQVTSAQAAVIIHNSITCWDGMGGSPQLSTDTTIAAAGGVYLLVGVEARPGVPVSVTDTMGSSYTLVNSAEANYAKTYLYLAQLASDMDAGTDHINVNTNSNMAYICAIAISGLETSPLDGSAIGSNNWGTNMSTGSVTPTTASTLLVGVFGWDSNTPNATPGANWTEQKETGALQIETRQVSSISAYSASATLDYQDRWAGVMVALKIRPPQPPTDITLSNNTIVASDPPGTLVGTLTAVDPDLGETYTFSLASGTGDTNNASFTITGNQLTNNVSLSAGTYSIRINVNDGTHNFAKAFSIVVSSYQTITGGDTSYGDYITNVALAELNHSSGNDNGYANYTAFTATVSPGSSPNLSCSVNIGDGAYAGVVVAWIDWDRNSSFDDAGEKYVIGTNINTAGANTINANIAVPAGAAEGSTRMRIVLNALDGATEPPNSGSTVFYGDAEDYTIQVIKCTSTGSTAWSSSSTWACGHVPDGNETVIIAASHTVSLGGNVTQNNTIELNGNINTAGYVLTLGPSATLTGSGDVIGTVRRMNPGTGSALQFNNQYTSLTFATAPTQIDITLAKTQPAGFVYAVDRTYTITAVGSAVATLRLHYKDTELHLANGATENSLNLFRYNGSAWTAIGRSAGDTTANWAEYNNVTSFSDWTIAGNTPTQVTLQDLSTNTGNKPLSFVVWLTIALALTAGGLVVLRRKQNRH